VHKVSAVLTDACISTVNLAETPGKMTEYGKPLEAVAYQVGRLQIPVISFDDDQACLAASLLQSTRAIGLSLGDRACLALAVKTSLPALTTESAWAKANVGVRLTATMLNARVGPPPGGLHFRVGAHVELDVAVAKDHARRS
jgi:PIN domain nuclease of toxin-antitoxin system